MFPRAPLTEAEAGSLRSESASLAPGALRRLCLPLPALVVPGAPWLMAAPPACASTDRWPGSVSVSMWTALGPGPPYHETSPLPTKSAKTSPHEAPRSGSASPEFSAATAQHGRWCRRTCAQARRALNSTVCSQDPARRPAPVSVQAQPSPAVLPLSGTHGTRGTPNLSRALGLSRPQGKRGHDSRCSLQRPGQPSWARGQASP